MQIYSLLAILFALLVAIFAIQNAAAVSINFLVWHFAGISLVLVILGAAAFGALVVFLLGLVRQLQVKRELRQLRNENRRLAGDLIRLERGTLETNEAETATAAKTMAATETARATKATERKQGI